MERKRKILKQVIRHLPQYSFEKEEMWRRVQDALMLKEDNLSNPVTKLPTFFAPEKLWKKIEESLNQKQTPLERAINELPIYKAPQGIWEKTNPRLKKKFIRFYDLRKIAAAASILLALSSVLFLISRREEMRFTRLERKNVKEIFQSVSYQGGLDILLSSALCNGNPEVFNSRVFIDLTAQLQDIKKELTKMEPLLKQHNPQLQNYFYRLENERIETEKQMIKLILEI